MCDAIVIRLVRNLECVAGFFGHRSQRPSWRVWAITAVGAALLLGLAPGAGAYVYWTNEGSGTIGRANADGSGVNQSFITEANGIYGLAVDGAHVYWANSNADTIGRANLDGSGVNQSFITGANNPKAVAVDGAHVYWTNEGSGTVGRASLDGSGANQSFIAGTNASEGLAVDGTYIYWANSGSGSGTTIGRANLDGSGASQSFISGASAPNGVAVDSSFIYWANQFTARSIGRANLDGSGASESFITGLSRPKGVAVDGGHVYWTDWSTNTIGRANLDGSGANLNFITGANRPSEVAVTASADTTPPSISVPGRLTSEATSASGAAVSYAVTATDAVDGPVPVNCSPASGSTFPIGSTVVNCTATDAAGNLAHASFEIVVAHLNAPVLSVPVALSAQATGAAGAVVTYAASAVDAVDGPITPACTPASGSMFAIGTTTVRCTATDRAGNTGAASFTVTVHAMPLPPVRPTPRLTALMVSPRTFRAARTGKSVSTSPKVGTKVHFRLTIAASVRFTVERQTLGRQVGSRCQAVTRKNRSKRRCNYWKAVTGSFAVSGKAGNNDFRFSGRLNNATLGIGVYRLTATPTSSGQTGKAQATTFTIKR